MYVEEERVKAEKARVEAGKKIVVESQNVFVAAVTRFLCAVCRFLYCAVCRFLFFPTSFVTPRAVASPILPGRARARRLRRANVVASCVLDCFAVMTGSVHNPARAAAAAPPSTTASGSLKGVACAPTNALRVAIVRKLRIESPVHRDDLIAARRAQEPHLSWGAAAHSVDDSIASVGSASHLDFTAMLALALAGGFVAHVHIAAHGARVAQRLLLGAGGTHHVYIMVSGPRDNAHAERVSHQVFNSAYAPSGQLSSVAGLGGWRIGSGRGSPPRRAARVAGVGAPAASAPARSTAASSAPACSTAAPSSASASSSILHTSPEMDVSVYIERIAY